METGSAVPTQRAAPRERDSCSSWTVAGSVCDMRAPETLRVRTVASPPGLVAASSGDTHDSTLLWRRLNFVAATARTSGSLRRSTLSFGVEGNAPADRTALECRIGAQRLIAEGTDRLLGASSERAAAACFLLVRRPLCPQRTRLTHRGPYPTPSPSPEAATVPGGYQQGFLWDNGYAANVGTLGGN